MTNTLLKAMEWKMNEGLGFPHRLEKRQVQYFLLKWFAIPFSSGPHSVRPLHHDPSILGGPTWLGLVPLS